MSNSSEVTGVLLVNLGTPDEPTPKAVRKYLAEFLHDKRVVDISRWIWCLILHGIILRFRPKRVAKLYASIWTEQGSPLLATTKAQAMALQSLLDSDGIKTKVALAMNYGHPSIAAGLKELSGCKKVVVLPLYPQFSSATTASVYDRIAKVFKSQWNLPELHFISDYHDHPAYIHALAESVKSHWVKQNESKKSKLIISFHGIPKRYADNGDPYPLQCAKTAKLLAQALELNAGEWQLTYQSRFGKEEWLQPYTDKTMEKEGQEGSSVTVICPGFAADCLETLEEIEEENKKLFVENGGQSFSYVPCLNNQKLHILMMAELIKARL